MTNAFIGFTFLIATLFPVGGYIGSFLLNNGAFDKVFGDLPLSLYPVLSVLMAYLPSAALTAWFFRSSGLAKRVPSKVPGSWMLLGGSILMAIYLVVRIRAAAIEGGGVAALVGELSPLIVYPAQALLGIGAVRLLLSARPAQTAST